MEVKKITSPTNGSKKTFGDYGNELAGKGCSSRFFTDNLKLDNFPEALRKIYERQLENFEPKGFTGKGNGTSREKMNIFTTMNLVEFNRVDIARAKEIMDAREYI